MQVRNLVFLLKADMYTTPGFKLARAFYSFGFMNGFSTT